MKSLATSLKILSAFSGERTSWSVSELASSLALEKPLVSKHLSCFRDAGFLQQDTRTKSYSPGMRSFLLGAQFLNNSELVRESAAELRRLSERSGQTSTLCALEGVDVIHLAGLEGQDFLDVGWRVGTWLPFHATAVGKVLFAFSEAALLTEAIAKRGMPRFTRTTICDPDNLRRQLAKIVKTGFAETDQETMEGLAAHAVPIFASEQKIVAALGFIFARHAVKPAQRAKQLRALQDSARKISARLGAQVYPFGQASR
jgi:DNA-binding IclR family transcriptional regulator